MVKVGFVNISFYFAACIALMFLLQDNYYALITMISIFLHEAAHIAVLLLVGGKVKQIDLKLCEMNIVTADYTLANTKKLLVTLAGPLINIALFISFWWLDKNFASINLAIAVFQLLPIKTLDGYRALGYIGISNRIRIILSYLLIFVFAIIGFLVLIYTKYNFTLLFVCMYLLFVSLTCNNDEEIV